MDWREFCEQFGFSEKARKSKKFWLKLERQRWSNLLEGATDPGEPERANKPNGKGQRPRLGFSVDTPNRAGRPRSSWRSNTPFVDRKAIFWKRAFGWKLKSLLFGRMGIPGIHLACSQ